MNSPACPRNILSANWKVRKLSCLQIVLSAIGPRIIYLQIGMSTKSPVTPKFTPCSGMLSTVTYLRLANSLLVIRLLKEIEK